MNEQHLARLVKLMAEIDDCPSLDTYATELFGKPFYGTWATLKHITRTSIPNIWTWSSQRELACFPADIAVESFSEFATFLLHEAAHGWIQTLGGDAPINIHLVGSNLEKVCWDISTLACNILGILFEKRSAMLSYQFYARWQAGDLEGVIAIADQLPAHNKT